MFFSIMVCQQINLWNLSRVSWADSCTGMIFAAAEPFLLKRKGEKSLFYLFFSANIRNFQLMERLCWQSHNKTLGIIRKFWWTFSGTEDEKHSEEELTFAFSQHIREMNPTSVHYKVLFLNLHKTSIIMSLLLGKAWCPNIFVCLCLFYFEV